MAKTEINNEIILLRHAVRQARVCVVNKVIREAKLLRNKHGNEAQREKYKRKADRLVAEVYALKTIEDDDISKFGIMNEKEIKDILQEQSLSDSDRIIAKIVHYKSLHRRLMQFREKFPDYKKYLAEPKKRTSKLKNKIAAKGKKSLKENKPCTLQENSKKQKVNSDKNTQHSQCNPNDEEIHKTEFSDATNSSQKRKRPLDECGMTLDREKLKKSKEDSTLENIAVDTQRNVIKPCGVTKEATVKRFTELLEEQESTQDNRISAESIDPMHITNAQAKPVDDFFITGDDQGNYQEDHPSASTSYVNSHKSNTQTETSQSSNRVKTQNTRYRNDGDFNKIQTHNRLRNKSKGENINQDRRHLGKQSSVVKEKKRESKITKSTNKSNLSDINNKEESSNLHPSWLAKKRQQEIMRQGFQGKKIVFD